MVASTAGRQRVRRFGNKLGRDRRLLVYILIISLAALVMGWGGIRQAQDHLLRTEARVKAVHWATFLQNNLSGLDEILAAGLISGSDQRVFDFASEAGGVLRYGVIRPDGVIAHSSWSGDFGGRPAEPHVIEAMKRGAIVTQVIEEELAREGKAVIAQAYVPISDGGALMGAIKVYVDMTARAAELRRVGDTAFAALNGFLLLLFVLCGFLVWHNILERRQVEEARRKSEAGLANAQRIAHLGNWTWDVRTNELGWSDEVYRIFSLDPREVAATFEIFWTFVHPDDKTMVWEAFDKALNDNQSLNLDHRIVLADGQERVVHQQGEVTFERSGKPVRVLGTLHDITERKRSEETIRELSHRNELILGSVGEGIFGLDLKGRTTFANPAAARMTGREPDELIGLHHHDIFAHADLESGLPHSEVCSVCATIEDGAARPVLDEALNRPDGSSIRVEYVTTPIREDTSVLGAVVVLRDITQWKQTEEEMREAKEVAELAARAKTEFLANMGHELRTPLNAVIGFSEIMTTGALGPIGSSKYLEYAKDIHDSGIHLLNLINDILDLSKIEAGKAELHEETVDVAKAIDSCVSLMKERARAAGLTLETRIADGLALLRADERKLKQILMNLLSNAVKFTEPGGYVRVTAVLEPERAVAIDITDSGIGIAPETIAAALAPFGQADGRLNRKYEGSGLGLPLAKSHIELHGGTLEIDSEVGGGTTVKLRFPPERTLEAPSRLAAASPDAGRVVTRT